MAKGSCGERLRWQKGIGGKNSGGDSVWVVKAKSPVVKIPLVKGSLAKIPVANGSLAKVAAPMFDCVRFDW